MSVRRKTPLVTLGFILLLGYAILGNRFTTVHRFTPFASTNTGIINNETRAKTNKDDRRSMQSCVTSVNLLSRHIHDDQETYGLRHWSLPLQNGTIDFIDFPGLDDNILKSFRGRRIFFMGDSTTNNLHNWLYILLKIHIEAPYNISSLPNMHLSDANSIIETLHGCNVHRKNGAPPCGARLSNVSEIDLKYERKRNVCSNDIDAYEAMRDYEPDIIVANVGLWMLHFQARSRDKEGCVAHAWVYYEHWLENTLQIAEEVGARALFFKTTNTICSEKYTNAYLKANELYEMMDSETLLDCFNSIKFTHMMESLLSDDNIHNYCANGTFNNRGSAHLNQRLYNFVESHQQKTSLALHVFDDNIIKSCDYTQRGDGRHYHPLNLVRIRLLAHLISCIE